MRITYDVEVDAAYIYLTDRITEPDTVEIDDDIVTNILLRLGLNVSVSDNGWDVIAPLHRLTNVRGGRSNGRLNYLLRFQAVKPDQQWI